LSLASLQRSLEGVAHLSLDTGVFIAAGEDKDPRRECAAWLTRSVERGLFRCTISVINAAEIIAGGFAKSLNDGIVRKALLEASPNITIVPLFLDLATTAARVRSVTKLPLPDAIVLATAIDAESDAIVHTDRDWVSRAKVYQRTLRMIYLGDHCP
jgi:predicted nucleic acid-binding protein